MSPSEMERGPALVDRMVRDQMRMLRDQMPKIVQPEYAIGAGLITRDDYNKLKDEFFAQSELSLGLILPMILIVLGLKLMPQIGLEDWYWVGLCVALVPITAGLFWIGMERRSRFLLEISLLIEGNLQAKMEAAAAAAAKKALEDQAKNEQAKTKKEEEAKKLELKSAVAEAVKAKGAVDKVNVDVNIKE